MAIIVNNMTPPLRSTLRCPSDLYIHFQLMFETTPKKLQKLQFLPDILLSKKEKKEKKYESSQLILVRNVAGNFLQLFFALILFKHIRTDPLNKHLCT